MTLADQNVETLQTEVDQVKRDLDALKKETDETTKKNKAETLEKGVSSTKEKINKKIDELKQLWEETYKADIVKLEAMLITLETSTSSLDTLRTDVITKSWEISKSMNETVDTAPDVDKISAWMEELKTMATDLQTVIDDFKKNKETMTDEEKKEQQKEIEEKRLAMEAKRKEIQELIRTSQKKLKESNFDAIDDEELKNNLTIQKAVEEKQLADYQKQLDMIETPASTILGKAQNTMNKTWSWVKRNPLATWGIVLWAWLLIGWMAWLFKRKKKTETNETTEWKKEKKWFWKTGFGNLVKRWLVWTWAYFLIKWFSTGKRPWSHKEGNGTDVGDTMSSTENAKESFEKLIKDSPEKAETLNKMGNNVNEFYDKVYTFNDGSIPEGINDAKLWKGKEKYAWAIPHILDNSFSSIDNMESEKWFFMTCSYAERNDIKKSFSDAIGRWLWRLVNEFMGMFWYGGANTEENIKKNVTEFCSWKNDINEVHMVFRKVLKVFSYLNFAENSFLGKEIEKWIKEGKKIYKKTDDDLYESIPYPAWDSEEFKSLINEIQTNPERYKLGDIEMSEIRNSFRDKKISETQTNDFQTNEIFLYNPDIDEEVQDINKKRDVMIEHITSDKEGTLDRMKNDAEDEIADGMRESSKRLFPFLNLTEIVNNESKIRKIIKEDAWFKKMLQDFHQKFDEMKWETDIDNIKKEIDNYYATMKEMRITQNSVVESADENGNIIMRGISAFNSTFTGIGYCFSHWVQMLYDGKLVNGVKWIYGGVASVAVLGNALPRLSRGVGMGSIVRWATKVTTLPIKILWKWVNMVFPKAYTMSYLSNYIPSPRLKWYYSSWSKLTDAIGNWLSIKQAYKIFRYLPEWAGQSSEIFIKQVMKITQESQVNRIKNILFDADGKKITDFGKKFFDEVIDRQWVFSKKQFMYKNIDEAIVKYEQLKKIQGVTTSTEGLGDIVVVANEYSHLLQKGDDVTSLTQKILNEWNIVDKAKNINHFDDAVQVGKAKAYAEKILEMKEGTMIKEAWVESSSKIGQAWNKAKEMFSEGTQKIKQLFKKNPTVSPEMNAWLEKGIAESEQKVANITAKEFEAAQANPGSAEAQNVAKTINENLPFRKRLLKFSPFLIDAIFNIFDWVGMTKEAAEIDKVNQERAGVKNEQANFSFTVAGVEVVLFGLWMANVWNPAWRVILAVTGGIEVVKFWSRKYYEVVDSYYRNFEDFKRMYVAKIKQEIISKESWSESIDISFQERFQEVVSSIFWSTLHGEQKMTRTNITVDEALRGLIWLEETENYPYATVNLENFKSKEYEELQKIVNEQNDSLTTDVRDRFSYIKNKYGNQILSKNVLESAKGKENIDAILQESRKYISMKKNQWGENISEYQQHMIDDLNQNPNFGKLENLYKNSPLQLHKIMKSYPYFALLIQQQSSQSSKNLETINQNMDYMVRYYQYKTFGLLPSDIPDIEVNENTVDYGLMEKFFTNFEIQPSWLTKEQLIQGFQNGQIEMYSSYTISEKFEISSNIWQNVLYRIAKEVLGWYKGKNDLDDLKLFYTAENRETTGLYYEDGMRWANVHWWEDRMMGPDQVLNKVKRVEMLWGMIKAWSMLNTMIDTDTETGEKYINKEYWDMMVKIIKEETMYRLPGNTEKYKKTAYEYIKTHASWGKYVALPLDMINTLTRAWVENVGYYYYTWTDSGVVALEWATWTIPAFLKKQILHCGLTNNIEEYQIKEVPLSKEVQAYIESVDGMIHRINEVMDIDNEDMDVTPDIRNLIARRVTLWKEYSIGLRHMNQDIALSSVQAKYPQFFMSFENIYMALLHCSSDGRDNDVDTYSDYLTVNMSSRWSLIDFISEAWSIKPSISINGFEYPDTYYTYINSYIIPGKNKTTADLLNSANPDELAYGKFAANVVMKSVLEAGMVEFNENDEVTALYNATNRKVNTTALEKRLAWYFSTTPSFVSDMYT